MRPFKFTILLPTVLVLALLVPLLANGASFNTIYTFTNTCYPGELTFDKNGNLYGAASGQNGYIFELTPTQTGWVEIILYSFDGGADGANPESGLIFDATGNLYGMTHGGGLGYGTVFELTPGTNGWTKTTLYNFKGPFTDGDGEYPTTGSLIFDKQGNLYGSTPDGGVNNEQVCNANGLVGCGTVFELSPTSAGWIESALFRFNAMTDGNFPSSSPLMGPNGDLYVTALATSGCCKGGTLVQLTPSPGGWTDKVPVRFTGSTGELPAGNLVLYNHAIYGVTSNNGPNGGGTVYTVDQERHLSVLYSFSVNGSDGYGPDTGLTLVGKNVYGTTTRGGSNNNGTIYELIPSGGKWNEQVLYSFQVSGINTLPYPSGLIADSQGNLYGTTLFGGASSCGTAFEITP